MFRVACVNRILPPLWSVLRPPQKICFLMCEIWLPAVSACRPSCRRSDLLQHTGGSAHDAARLPHRQPQRLHLRRSAREEASGLNASASVLFVQLLRHTSPPDNHTNHVAFFSYCIFHPPKPSEPPFLTFTPRPVWPLTSTRTGSKWLKSTPVKRDNPPFQNNLYHQLSWVEFSSSVLQQAAVSWAALATGVLLHIGKYKNMAIKMLHTR